MHMYTHTHKHTHTHKRGLLQSPIILVKEAYYLVSEEKRPATALEYLRSASASRSLFYFYFCVEAYYCTGMNTCGLPVLVGLFFVCNRSLFVIW